MDISCKIEDIQNTELKKLFRKESKKDRRNKEDKWYNNRCKRLRKQIRAWQSKHNGKRPSFDKIPPGFYCYRFVDSIPGGADHICDPDNTIDKRITCPYYYQVEVPEEERDTCVALAAVGQTWYGGCTLINKTDLDFDGWGLLWDMCKECGLKDGPSSEYKQSRRNSVYEAVRRY